MRTMSFEQMVVTNGGSRNADVSHMACGGSLLLAAASFGIPVAGPFISFGLIGYHFANCIF